MKKLILMRHGKSSWDYNVGDRDRPLLERGIRDADLVSIAFKELNSAIDAVFSSPANRALHTSTIFLRNLDYPLSQFQVVNNLYDFSGDDVLQFVKNLDDSLQTVLVFGHNHAFTHIANSLGNTYINNVPTSGLVELIFSENAWAEITKGTTGKMIFPKHLKG